MSYTLTTDWDAIQERNIDPHSPRSSQNHNKLLKVMSRHKAYIGGLDLDLIYDTENNRVVAQLSEGIVVLNFMCIEFKEKPTIILFECPTNEQDFYVVVEYEYKLSLPKPIAVIKVIPTASYDPNIHLRLYYLHLGRWTNIPTEEEFTEWISSETNFKDYRYEHESLPEWAVESFVLKRGDTILGTVLAPDPTEEKQIVNKKYVDESLNNIGIHNYVRKDGDEMYGPLILSEHPDTSSYQPLISKQAATKGYVDYWINHILVSVGEAFSSGPYLPIAGGSMEGYITLHANPINTYHAATKAYVDNSVDYIENNFLRLSGGTMTGYITLHDNPVDDYHPATKLYTDNTFLPLTGGTVSGYITLHDNPTEDYHAVPKIYVDSNCVKYAEYTDEIIFDKIKNNSGPGSGLDADTVDGLHAHEITSNKPVFINRVRLASGGGTRAWTTVNVSAYIPEGAHTVILDAEGHMCGPDSGDVTTHMKIRKDSSSSANVIIIGRASGGSDSIAVGAQGIFPVTTYRTFDYTVEYPGFGYWALYLVGYIK